MNKKDEDKITTDTAKPCGSGVMTGYNAVRKEVIGDCTLYQGDCLEILPSLTGIDAVISDPPYGMNYKPQDWKKWNGKKQDWKPIEGDDVKFKPGHLLGYPIVVLWGASYYMEELNTGKLLVWDKRCGPDGDKMFGTSIEIGWLNVGGGEALIKRLLHGGVINADSRNGNNEKRIHPTQKPVGLMAWSMDVAGVGRNDTVLDPYMGSGTTGVACIRTGRKFIGIEKDETHFENACERIKRECSQGRLF